ncbi:MAG: hypothetical protein Q8R28_10375 [Dehalococcoidia bacterium]|nr:hypothetical protein [Dehalococcoidia bacterium]
MKTSRAGLLSAIIYTAASLVIASLFFAISAAKGFDWVARLGGGAWVFMLCMIVLMPIVTPLVKSRMGE